VQKTKTNSLLSNIIETWNKRGYRHYGSREPDFFSTYYH